VADNRHEPRARGSRLVDEPRSERTASRPPPTVDLLAALQRSAGNCAVARALAAGDRLTQRPAARAIQRVAFGSDGPLSPAHQATVRTAAEIAERLVAPTNGLHTFRSRWQAFWSGPGARIDPKPTLEQYQAAVRNRVLNDMDSSTHPGVRAIVAEERDSPLERQTAAVTLVGSDQTYLRRFGIEQGVDSVVSMLLHESLHGAGLSMGPAMMYEPLFHKLEADVGFPMMMGGGDIVSIAQARRGDTDVDVTVTYRLRTIDEAPIPEALEIQIVSAESGEIVYDEQADGTRRPAKAAIASRPGTRTWVWRARNPGVGSYAVRIRDLTSESLVASRDFRTDPRCVIGVSSMHCEGE
jgi:hypothetical protein